MYTKSLFLFLAVAVIIYGFSNMAVSQSTSSGPSVSITSFPSGIYVTNGNAGTNQPSFTMTGSASGGTGTGYSYEWLVGQYNSPSCSSNPQITSSNPATFSYDTNGNGNLPLYAVEPNSGPFNVYYCLRVTDSLDQAAYSYPVVATCSYTGTNGQGLYCKFSGGAANPVISIQNPTSNPTSITLGNTVTLSDGGASGGTGVYQYYWLYELPGGSGYNHMYVYSTAVTYKPTSIGTYKFEIVGYDKNGDSVVSEPVSVTVSPVTTTSTSSSTSSSTSTSSSSSTSSSTSSTSSTSSSSTSTTVTPSHIDSITISSTPPNLDSGFNSIITVNIAGGTAPYKISLYQSGTSTCPSSAGAFYVNYPVNSNTVSYPSPVQTSSSYYCAVVTDSSNPQSTLTSNPLFVATNKPLSILSIVPSSGVSANEIDVGQSTNVGVSVNGGTGNFVYDWSAVGSCPGFSSANTPSFIYTPTSSTQDCSFSVDANDGMDSIKETTGNIIVNPDPTVYVVPQTSDVVLGQPAYFTAMASGGTGTISYSWYNVTGGYKMPENSQSIELIGTQNGAFEYKVTITDSVGLTATSDVTLNVGGTTSTTTVSSGGGGGGGGGVFTGGIPPTTTISNGGHNPTTTVKFTVSNTGGSTITVGKPTTIATTTISTTTVLPGNTTASTTSNKIAPPASVHPATSRNLFIILILLLIIILILLILYIISKRRKKTAADSAISDAETAGAGMAAGSVANSEPSDSDMDGAAEASLAADLSNTAPSGSEKEGGAEPEGQLEQNPKQGKDTGSGDANDSKSNATTKSGKQSKGKSTKSAKKPSS